MTAAMMWQRYAWRGYEVIVVQQWSDPFGRRMVRVSSAAPGEEDTAAGLAEADFLAEAQPLAADLDGG